MDGARTIGQRAALGAIERMIAATVPHAILFAGEAGVGKTTLALDLAAGLLCTAASRPDRPCRVCRGCRLVASGNHPDLHRLAPSGPGGQIRIGERSDPEPGTVRALLSELALLPVEGGARVAIVEAAHRMNEDAQSALLKTLEEPPPGTIIILCADEEERLLETVRSRCVRYRLGPVGVRDIEGFLAGRGVADAPTGARLARIARGRPGVALVYALAPDAALIRAELARTLLDLLRASRAERLTMARDLLVRSADLVHALETANRDGDAHAGADGGSDRRGRASGRGPAPARGGRSRTSTPSVVATVDEGMAVDRNGAAGPAGGDDRASPASEEAEPVAKITAAARRRSAGELIEIWRDLVRDVAFTGLGEGRSLRDPALADDLAAAQGLVSPAAAALFLERLVRAGELLESNVVPELIVDDLVIRWRPHAAA